MASECSFDIVSKVDLQEVDNAVQQTMKEVRTRYDFKGSVSEVTRSGSELTILSDDRFRLSRVLGFLNQPLAQRGAPDHSKPDTSESRASPREAPLRRSCVCRKGAAPIRRARS